MRIGFFGGSFDPVHYGHLLLAESCREQCRLDEVWFVPAAVPPHKRSDDRAEAKHRVAMLELAIAGNAAFRVSTIELDRGGVSFTVDTLSDIKSQQPPDAELFLLLGGDSVHDFPTWREPQRILDLATPVAVSRAGSPSPDFSDLAGLVTPERLDEIRRHTVEMPLVEFSSTEIRTRVAAGRSVRYMTPRAVEVYVAEQGLYRMGRSRGVRTGVRE
jgi:nicotinate-nucleotide adenylyltransferase